LVYYIQTSHVSKKPGRFSIHINLTLAGWVPTTARTSKSWLIHPYHFQAAYHLQR